MKISLLIATIVAALPAFSTAQTTFDYKSLDYEFGFDEDRDLPRSMIMMIPDGTDPAVYTMARTVLDPTLKKRLHIDPLLLGQVQTHSSTSLITDSAAAATAYSTGFKTYDASIGMDHYHKPIATILEAAKARGMITGMVVTSRVTHATPAGFAAHIEDRNDEGKIAEQYVANKNLDFLLGGGGKFFNDTLYSKLKSNGYTIVKNNAELQSYRKDNEASGKLRVFGIFHKSHMTYEIDRRVDAQKNDNKGEPSLAEMVDTIFSILKNNPVAQKNGFFMMIEGSRVDHAGHSNDPGTIAREAIAFDEAVGVTKHFVASHKNVGVIAVADHGTGGMTLGRDGIYAWDSQAMLKQTMSTERMAESLQDILDKECKPQPQKQGDNSTCKASLLKKATELIGAHSNVTTFTNETTADLQKEIAKAVDKTRDLTDTTTEMGHIISKPALIGWTSDAHDGQDVDLHCLGPADLEKMCKGLHENTHMYKIMSDFLDLGHLVEAETLRLRGFQTLEDGAWNITNPN